MSHDERSASLSVAEVIIGAAYASTILVTILVGIGL
jgi:hypothetical protein